MKLSDLRPYQNQACAAVIEAWDKYDKVLLSLPCGAGKTVCAAFIISAWLELAALRGEFTRILWLAHRDELITQAAEMILDVTGQEPGIEKAELSVISQPHQMGRAVVVSSIQTMSRPNRMKKFDKNAWGLICIDEAHHCPSPSYLAVLDYFKNYKLLGLTATTNRTDQVSLGKVFDHVAYHYELSDAVKDGWLAPIKQHYIQTELDFSKVRLDDHGDLSAEDLDRILLEENAIHKIVAPVVKAAGDRPTIIFTPRVRSAEAVAAVLGRPEYSTSGVRVVSGKTPDDERREITEGFRRGDFQYLANCLDQQTEILTSSGWASMGTVHCGDLVASVPLLPGKRNNLPGKRGGGKYQHSEIGKLSWVPVQAVIQRAVREQERMVRIKAHMVDARITEGHRMLTKAGAAIGWKIAEARQLIESNTAYKLLAAVQGTLPGLNLTLDECRFLGMFLADGHLTAGSRGIVIQQSDRYEWANKWIVKVLTGCNFDWVKTSKKVKPSQNIQSQYLQHIYRIPKGNCGGKLARRGYVRLEGLLSKNLAPELLALNRQQALALIEGVWVGDGLKQLRPGCKRRSWIISNTNKTMLDRLQQIAIMNGRAANLNGPKRNGLLATKPIYNLSIRDRDTVATNNGASTGKRKPSTYFDEKLPGEQVWCVTNENGTIITRRNGKVTVMGQCAVYTEGADFPRASCIVIARPTKSKLLLEQMIGRGLRGGRLCPVEGKDDGCLVIDLMGVAQPGNLVHTADLLGGKYDEVVVAEAKRRCEEKAKEDIPADVLAELEAANLQAEELRHIRRMNVVADAKLKVEIVDPFTAFAILDKSIKRMPGWYDNPATEEQVQFLSEHGIKAKGALTYSEAKQLRDEVGRRRREGLATYKQLRKLMCRGYTNLLTKEQASVLLSHMSTRPDGWRFGSEDGKRANAAKKRGRPFEYAELDWVPTYCLPRGVDCRVCRRGTNYWREHTTTKSTTFRTAKIVGDEVRLSTDQYELAVPASCVLNLKKNEPVKGGE